MIDVIIVGAGIAGMTAAIYARRAGKTVLVLEGKVQGGQIVGTLRIENWPGDFGISGADLTRDVYQQVLKLGAEVEFEEVARIEKRDDGFLVKTEDNDYLAKTVILAVGTEDKKLGLPREEKLVGLGISYCATCDGALFNGKDVAVIGGGNTALYDALYLSDIARRIYLVHRRDSFRGDMALVEKVRAKDNVEFVLKNRPVEILGEAKVEGLKLEDGRVIEVAGVFAAVGKKPATSKFSELVKLDEKGYIEADESCKTSCDGVFAAGDCRTKNVRQLVTAAADGAVAAGAAINYLNE